MFRAVPIAVVALAVAASGCKSPQTGVPTTGEPQPALLVGPDAAAKAPPPVELPTKESVKLCLVTAQGFEKEGRVEDAIRLYEKVRASEPANTVALRRLATLYDKSGDFAKSAELYEALVKASPKDADLQNDLGYSHYCRGDWSGAVAALSQAVRLDPNHKRAWVNLGLAQAQLANWDASYDAFCKAVRPADAHSNIAFVLAAQGKKDEAKERYRQALALDPGLRVAQIAVAQLDRPVGAAEGEPKGRKAARRDPAEAAAQVPSVAEIEARLKKEKDSKQLTPSVIEPIGFDPEGEK